jgi:glucokinase
MSLLGIDLGGTKLASAIFSEEGEILYKESIALEDRKGDEVGKLIVDQINYILNSSELQGNKISSIGISVPGIYHSDTGNVWAPNIPGWDDYPLFDEVKNTCKISKVTIDSDRACYILGEVWKGNASGCRNAVFLAVGTGIGAGILIDGEVLRGSSDIAGAIGWMALDRPFKNQYTDCGCFEYYASGEGIAKNARRYIIEDLTYTGELKNRDIEKITSRDVFAAWEYGDQVAVKVIDQCIELWGMAIANLVSLFNPEVIIFGGGVFGPAIKLIPAIKEEAEKWAQPVSMKQVKIIASGLAGDAGVYGAGYLAFKNIQA